MERPGLLFSWWSTLRNRPARKVDALSECSSLGSTYGGYTVKSNLLGPDSVVYSFGIGEDLSFDLALIERFGLTVHAFDPTPRAIAFTRGVASSNIVLHEYGLLDRDGVVTFNPPKNPAHVSQSVLDPSISDRITSVGSTEFEVRRLSTIAGDLGHGEIDVLKMDVEGAEYGVIDDLERNPMPIGQILLEFHHMLPGIRVAQTERAIDQLRGLGFRPFAVSDTGREWSFIHESRL